MGFKDWLYGQPSVPAEPVAPEPPKERVRFTAIGSDFESWNALVNGWGDSYVGAYATRAEAIHVPAIKRARDVICRLGTLPLHATNARDEQVRRALLEQPEKYSGFTRSHTLSWTMDDLLFHGKCLWRVRDREWSPEGRAGFPEVVERIPRSRWNYDEDTGKIMVDGEKLNPLDAILFLSPNDGLLYAGGGAIRALIALEATAAQRINQPQSREFFRSISGVDYQQSEIDDFLSDFQAARRKNVSGFLPADLERIPTEQPTPEELQLSSAREFSILEVSRLTGLNPSWLAAQVPGSSMTYTNAVDARRDLVDFQASPYLSAIEERLSLNDVTPNGTRVRYNMDAFLRANTAERYSAHATAITSGFLTVNEVRALENRVPLDGGDTPTSTPAEGGQ